MELRWHGPMLTTVTRMHRAEVAEQLYYVST